MAGRISRRALGAGRACAALAISLFISSPGWAVDVPFSIVNQGVDLKGVGKLENGHFAGQVMNGGFQVQVTGEIRGGELYVQATGPICSPGKNDRLVIGTGSGPGSEGKISVTLTVNCANNWTQMAVASFEMPANAQPTAPATSSSQPSTAMPAAEAPAVTAIPPIDPIDETYIAINPVKVREQPDVSSARVKTIEVGQKINVMGKVKGQDWYEVSENDKPIGFVIANQLVPESQYHSAVASITSAAPATVPPAPAAAAPQPAIPPALANLDFGNYQALVIGNDSYQNGLPALKTATGDAKAVAQTLKTAYGFKVTLLVNATRDQIIGALAKLRERLTWDDNLLIYYAGHGSYDQAADQGYWLPVDAAPDDPSHWVSNTDITNMLRAIQARHVMVVADSCYSGTLTRDANVGIRTSDYIQRMVQKKARTVMTSGGLEPVADSGDSGHSVFAAAFIAALQQNGGVMDAQTFFAKVREPVVLAAPQTPEYSNLRFAGHEGGDFVFVRKQ